MQSSCLSFNKGLEINCGIDLIGISISDGIEGFRAFLSAYHGSFVRYKKQSSWQTVFAFNYENGNYEGIYNRGAKRLLLKVGGLTQYSDTSKSFSRWTLLQKLYFHYGEAMSINEMHFAVDVPYRYADITIFPKEKVNHSQYRSVQYFDIKREPGKTLNRDDDFVIYDKCRKCRIATPLTRIELRLKGISGDVVSDQSYQKRIANKVQRKFKDVKLKKGRSPIRIDRCDWEKVISDTIDFIAGDSRLYQEVLKHREETIEASGRLFKAFMKYCKENNIYSSKPQLSQKAKPFLTELPLQQRQMLNRTIASYNAYDTRWHQDPRFKMKDVQAVRRRLTDELRYEILFLVQQGQTQASIAEELKVSESTISRWLHGYVWLRDSKMLNIFTFR